MNYILHDKNIVGWMSEIRLQVSFSHLLNTRDYFVKRSLDTDRKTDEMDKNVCGEGDNAKNDDNKNIKKSFIKHDTYTCGQNIYNLTLLSF